MPRTDVKAINTLMDIWEKYSQRLLADNPDWFSRYFGKIRNCYLYRKTEDGKVVEMMSYYRFKKTMEHYFDRAAKAIIAGECINLTNRVGKVTALRVERDFTKKRQRAIDWKKTNSYGFTVVNGKRKYVKVVYMTTSEWCRIAWKKTRSMSNGLVYEFAAASANSKRTSGFKLAFSEAIIKDPLLKYQYLYSPRRIFYNKKATA